MEIVKIEKPQLPIHWEYSTSIKYVGENIFKWKNMTAEIAQELWVAREMLNNQKKRGATGTFVPMDKTWAEYCDDIGSSKQVVNRWLKGWFETVHVSNNSGENEWYTPPKYIEAARAVMGEINLDPASSELANETVQAEMIHTAEDDGLNYDWHGSVWMNPPYAQPLIQQFSDKLIKELPNIDQACVLVNNATDTEWLQGMIKKCDCICLVKGRVRFIDKNGNPSGAPLQGQVVLYFGSNTNNFITEFKQFGICLNVVK